MRSPPAIASPIHNGAPFPGGIDSGCIDDVLSSSAVPKRCIHGPGGGRERARNESVSSQVSAREAGAGRTGTAILEAKASARGAKKR
jgi:hypothetical protein